MPIQQLTGADESINVLGNNDTIQDFGGSDTYQISPTLSGDVVIQDANPSTIILPAGMTIDAARFTSNGLQFDINGFTLELQGDVENFTFVFGGDPLDPATGTQLSFEDTAVAFGTTVPTSGVSEGTISGDIVDDGTVADDGTGGGDPGDPGDPGTPGQTFNLTPGTDESPEFDGTDDNDTYVGALSAVQDGGGFTEFQTLTNTDVLDGGLGTDVLNATLIDGSGSGSATTPEQIDSIENIFLTSRAQANELDMSNVTGAEQVWNDDSTQDLTVSDLQNEVTLGVIEGNDNDFNAEYASGSTSAGFTQNVVLEDADIGTLNVNDLDNNLTGLAVNVIGTDAELDLAGDLPNISDLIVEGDAGLDISNTKLNGLETIDSTTTGDVSVVADNALETASFGEGDDSLETDGNAVESIGMGAGDDDVTIVDGDLNDGAAIDMGDDDDRLDLGDNLDLSTTAGVLDTTVSLNGGAGIDTLAMTSATAAAVSTDDAGFDAQFENFQKLEVGPVAENETPTVDLANMNDIDYVITDSIAAATTPAQPEVHTFNVTSGADANGGSFFLNGVEITAVASGSTSAVADAIASSNLANAIAEIDTVTASGSTVTVTYTEAAGNVADNFLEFEENPDSSGVTFNNSTAAETTMGVVPVPEQQTLVVDAGTVAAGQQVEVGGLTITLDGGLNVDETGQAIADAVNANPTGVTSSAPTANPVSAAYDDANNTLTFTFDAADDDVGTIPVDGDPGTVMNDVFDTTSATTDDMPEGDEGVDEVQTFIITNGTDANGGNIVIGDQTLALDPSLSVGQVGVAIVDAYSDGQLQTINGNSVIDISLGTNPEDVVITFDRDEGNVDEVSLSDDPATSTVAINTPTATQFVPGSQEGELTLDNLQSGGTVELTDDVDGSLVINVTDAGLASSTNDVVNLRLNTPGNNLFGNLYNEGIVRIDDVEIINIDTTNSGDDNPALFNELGLDASSAETVTVTGNQGIWFNNFGGDLSSMTLLDASGVQAVESTPGADDAGLVGYVEIDTGATDADVTLLTGNGDDVIDASFVGTDPADTGSAATIDAGAGDDEIIGSQGDDVINAGEGNDIVESTPGADVITLGAGNDTYELAQLSDSVINDRDVITDFSPNTVGQGAGGAVTDGGAAVSVDDRDGDVIDLSPGGFASIDVATFANASDATTFLANTGFDGELNVALDSSSGLLYIDAFDDGIADSVIELTGVSTIDEAAFVIA